ncbi:TolC family protein [Variovorax sp. dw_954]|uniref:TolC family protein n=1 Tax=Variovorax sp. dw_954 TaxID=2720078 RepID=UPI001BD25AD8|nr:TolC family protein [Variovorax sp. dw_954]
MNTQKAKFGAPALRLGKAVLKRPAHAALLCIALTGCAVAPQPFEARQNKDRATDLIQRVAADQEPVVGAIDLYEAMARALKYNLDSRVELMTVALSQRELDLKSYDMLPKAVVSLDYAGRNNDSGGISRSISTGRTSLEPSTSSDRNVLASDLTLSWDVLDFGLSYVRAKQAADEVNIAEERKRKVANRIVEDVRTAYWRAVSAERLLGKINELEVVTKSALEQAEKQEKAGLSAPLAPLTYQRELLSIRREAQNLGRELSVAKQQLAALMNLPPDTQFKVAMPTRTLQWKPFSLPGKDMLQTAIENRPELREVAYQLRNNDREETAAYLRALPSLRVFAGLDASSNSFLYNANWLGFGARASWNLLNVFSLPAAQAKVKAQGQLLDQRALALTMAVGTQVEVARARYEFRIRELDTASRYYGVQEKIEKQIDAGFKADKLSRQTLIREQMNTLVSEVRYDMALADLQNAYANVYSSLGIDPVDKDMSTTQPVNELAGRLRGMWAKRQDAVATAASPSKS